jgi:hypothetical protein
MNNTWYSWTTDYKHMYWPPNQNYIIIFYVTLEIIQDYSIVVVLLYLLFKKNAEQEKKIR